MNKKELKRLSRADLLEMLIIKCRENEQLHAELEEARKAAEQRTVPAGSNEQMDAVFHALRIAAEQYFETARRAEMAPAAAAEEAK